MADISKIQVGSTTYDIKDKAQHSDLTTTTKTIVGGINELQSSKQEKIFFTEPSSPKDGDIWIDEDDHAGEDIPTTNAGQVEYDSQDTYPNSTVGKELKEQSSQISALETDVTNLEAADTQIKDMISDAWTQRTWTVGEYCIHNNILWECLVNNSSEPTDGANWRSTSISEMNEYVPGDVINISEYDVFSGLISSSQKSVRFTVQLDKSLRKISSMVANSMIAGIRTVEGKYLNGSSDSYEWVGQSGITVTVRKVDERTASIEIRTSGTFTNAPPNNTPICGLLKYTITLS